MAARRDPARLTDRSRAGAARRRGAGAASALHRGLAWLEGHREFLLPDAALFWSLAIDIGRRGAGAARSHEASPDGLRGGEGLGVRLSADYRRVVARMRLLRSRLPLAAGSGTWWWSGSGPARGRRPGDGCRGAAPLQESLAVDAALINRALAAAAAGRPSARMRRWLRDGASSTGYTLSHKLLGLALLAAADGRLEMVGGRGVARRVLAELHREGASAYVDLTAQRVACLALAGCPASALRTGIEWLMQRQRRGGDWDYFEAACDPHETLERVFTGRSPLLRPPIWDEPRDPMIEARTIALVHRGHATAVASCALACFTARGRSV